MMSIFKAAPSANTPDYGGLSGSRPCFVVLAVAGIAALLLPSVVKADLGDHQPSERARLETYVGMFNELAERRRRVIYTNYPSSPRRGIAYDFVHTADGTAALARTDLVVDAAIPIVIRRAYHSARDTSAHFGAAGWRLTVAETIVETRDGFAYTYGNSDPINLRRDGGFVEPIDAFFSDVIDFDTTKRNRIAVETRTGTTKIFHRGSNTFRIALVSDSYGNRLMFKYRDDQLQSIRSSDGALVRLSYDPQGRLVMVQDSVGRQVRYEYDVSGRLRTVVDVRGQPWHYKYRDTGELISAETPNGHADVAFSFDDGRVRRATRNGFVTTFDYAEARTIVTSQDRRKTVFEADNRGITSRVTNALGVTTEVEFGEHGLPIAVVKGDQTVVAIEYSDVGRAVPRRAVSAAGGATTSETFYDGRSRVLRAVGSDGANLYEVEGYDDGLRIRKAKANSAGAVEARYDNGGELSYLAQNDSIWHFRRTGQTMRVTAPNGRSASLRFNGFGQLEEAAPLRGSSVRFEYEDDGMRSGTVTESGAVIGYRYDASGNLFSTSVGYAGDESTVFAYVQNDYNRLDSILAGDVEEASFEYNELGLPTATRARSIISLAFDYDGLGRLQTIVPEGGRPLTYEYGEGEADIASQLDSTTAESITQQKEISDFGSRTDVFLSRIRPSNYGILTYEQTAGEFSLFANPAYWSPESQLLHVLANTRLAYLLHNDGPQYGEFAKPSNRYFIPAEFWAINCCFCCHSHHGVDCEIP